MFLRPRFGVALASPNRQGATGGTTWRTTRLRLVWRPPYYHGVRKSSIWRPIRRNRARRAPYGDGHGRKTRAREKGRGKCRCVGKHRARGRLGVRGERSAGEIREQREERSQGRRTYLLARANAFARAAGRSCCRRGSASPSPIPYPREEQPPMGCCFPVTSSGPPLSRTRAASPLPSLFPTRGRSSRQRTVVSPPPPLVNIEQEQDPSRLLQSSLEQEILKGRRRRLSI